MKFEKSFDRIVGPGDSIELEANGLRFVARIEHDPDYHIDDEQQEKLIDARYAWMRDEWFYGSVVVGAYLGEFCLDSCAASLSGIECNYPGSDNSYLTEEANGLLPDALDMARAKVGRFLELSTVI